MPIYNGVYTQTITTGGGTINLDVSQSTITRYIFDGTATLSSSWTIQSTGTPVAGMEFDIRWYAQVSLDGNNVTIFGQVLTQEQAENNLKIIAYYNGSTWDVLIEVTDVVDDEYKGAEEVVVPTSGTLTLNAKLNKKIQKFTGNPTLIAPYAVTGDVASALEGDEFFLDWRATVTTSGSTITLFGIVLTTQQALSGNLVVHAYFDGSAWIGKLVVSEVYINEVDNTKLSDMAALTVKANANNTSDSPQDVSASSANTVFKRNNSNQLVFDSVRRNDLETSTSTADGVGLSNIQYIAAETLIGNNTGGNAAPSSLTPTQVKALLNLDASTVVESTITLSSAQMLALNGTPIDVIPSPGVNKAIDLISGVGFIDYNSAAYATNTHFHLTFNTANDSITTNNDLLLATTDLYFKLAFVTKTGTTAQLLTNTSLKAYVPGGNPTLGDSPLILKLAYRIIDFS